MTVCCRCKNNKQESDFSFRSTRPGKLKSYCKKCSSESVSESRRKKRIKIITLMGSKCSSCGYFKCQRALELHHVNRNEKSSTFRSILSWTWKRILKELERCILLCANCHREEEERLHLVDDRYSGR